MQTLNVPYKGMNPTPDDYLCEDGLADTAVDLEMRSGGWHAMRRPKSAVFSVDGFMPRYVHHTSDGNTFFFGLKEGTAEDSGKAEYTLTAYSYKEGETPTEYTIENAPTSESAESFDNFCNIGNIVNLTVNGTIVHIIYIKGKFRKVSHVPPFVPIQFAAERFEDNVSMEGRLDGVSLSSILPNSVECVIGATDYPYKLPTQFQTVGTFTDKELIEWYKTTESYSGMFNACFAQHNSIRKRLQKDGALMYPVLLRYALKLYDGSYVQTSVPILIFPVQNSVECVAHPAAYKTIKDDGTHDADDGRLFNGYEEVSWPSSELKYHFKSRPFNYECYKIVFDGIGSNETKNALQSLIDDYRDIVQSIDFFLSDELFTIDTAEMEVVVTDNVYNYEEKRRICSPQFKERKLEDAIKNVSAFFKVKSIKLRDLESYMLNYKPLLDESSDTLENYTEFERLDVGSIYEGVGFGCNGLRAYNNRLLAFGIGSNYPDMQRLTICTPPIHNIESSGVLPPNVYGKYLYPTFTATSAEVEIEDTMHQDNIVIRSADSFKIPIFFFYPNARAKNFYALNDEGEADIIRQMELTEHPLLIGMYFFKNRAFEEVTGWGSADDWGTPVEEYPDATENAIVLNYANQVKESEVNNPFVFKDGNSTTCGSGKVLSIATTAQPTSTGQFGQYPLLAFCTDGVFAIGISSTGTLQTCSPYALDIVNDPRSVTCVNGMVTFATTNGLVGLGSSSERRVLLPGDKTYPRFITAVQDLVKGQNLTLAPYDASAPDLHTYLTSGAQTTYDYTHNRLFLFNPAYAWTYVCDMDTLSWSVHTAQFSRALDEPDKCYLVGADGKTVWDYSTDDIREKQSGWLLTRPCKFDARDLFKTIGAVVQRGYFGERDRNAVQQALFGSENLCKWYPVFTSESTHMRNFHGTPYKAFRILAMCKDWTQDLALSAATLAVEGRLNDQPR